MATLIFEVPAFLTSRDYDSIREKIIEEAKTGYVMLEHGTRLVGAIQGDGAFVPAGGCVEALDGKQRITVEVKAEDEQDKEQPDKVFYLCDRRACEKCNAHCGGETECKHTQDIHHARNFERIGRALWEVELVECAEGVMELPGVFIDDERLKRIEGYLAKLVDANGKEINIPAADIRGVEPAALAKVVGEMCADGLRMGIHG